MRTLPGDDTSCLAVDHLSKILETKRFGRSTCRVCENDFSEIVGSRIFKNNFFRVVDQKEKHNTLNIKGIIVPDWLPLQSETLIT